MARFISQTVGTGQSISTSDLWIKSLMLSANGSNDCSATIKCNGNTEIIICAAKGTTAEYPTGKGGNDFNTEHLPGPVTVDIVGTGAFFRISF